MANKGGPDKERYITTLTALVVGTVPFFITLIVTIIWGNGKELK